MIAQLKEPDSCPDPAYLFWDVMEFAIRYLPVRLIRAWWYGEVAQSNRAAVREDLMTHAALQVSFERAAFRPLQTVQGCGARQLYLL